MKGANDWPSTQANLLERLLERLRKSPIGPDWDTFVEIYSRVIYRFCRSNGLQDADARDVSQSVFLVVRRGISKFEYDPERGRFRSWLGTLVKRQIGKHRQRDRREGNGVGGDENSMPEVEDGDALWIVEFNSHILESALIRIRHEFDPDEWQAFNAVWMQGTKPQEVADAMQAKPDWIYRAKYKILKRLKSEVLFLTADIPSFSKQ